MERTHIAAAIILSPGKSRIFITQRPNYVHKGGFWEFPGGKVETGESIEQAVIRELEEETTVQVTEQSRFEAFEYDYCDKLLVFDFVLVTEFRGIPCAKEGQQSRWVRINELLNFFFPEANIRVVEKIVAHFT